MKQKINIKTAKLFNHLHKVKKRHVERFVHTWTHTHHTMIHMGELVVVGIIGFSSLLFANYNNSYQHLHRNTSQEIVQSLTKAIQQEKIKTNESKIISVWEMDGNVNNTFAQGYCTYGAARISPEFFPYSEDKMSQERTRGGNAIDRCEGAEKAGFKIGSTPSIGSLIVYKKVGNNVTFGHVGKVMYYNNKYKSLIVRDMNWIAKFIMSDRWENSENENIKCYIYPGKTETNTSNEQIKPIENNDKFDISTNNIPTNNIQPNITNNQTHNSAEEIVIEEIVIEEIIVQEPENNNLYKELKEEILIEQNKDFSDITNHFLSQHEMKIIVSKKNTLKVGENISLKINIINKETKETYQGILPFMFNSIMQNNILDSSLKTIQFIHSDENIIYFKAKEKGETAILLTIGDYKIITIPILIEN